MGERLVNKTFILKEDSELSLRPIHLDEYIGQSELKEVLNIYITAAKKRNESLDHILLYGPPGLGKTTLSNIIGYEMNSKVLSISGASITRCGDLVSILSSLDKGDILFIDEIHRIPKVVEEILYSAMEDYTIDIVIGKDSSSMVYKIDLVPFTLIGATTRFGDLTQPLRDRFGIVYQMNYYSIVELQQIINRTSKVFNCCISEEASLELAKRSRGTPRIANRLLKRIRDFAFYNHDNIISFKTTCYALNKLMIDENGLDKTDRNYLEVLIEKFNGGPIGLRPLVQALNIDAATLEDVNEPYLLQEGYIKRTSRGRIATLKAYQHLNKKKGEA